MNKLVLNEKGRNHIKVFPLVKGLEVPTDAGEKIKWCNAKYDTLRDSENAKCLYMRRYSFKGFMISSWKLDNEFYLIQSIRNEFKTYNNVMYILDNENDAKAIAKFLTDNINQLMKDYKMQILEGKEYLQEKEIEAQAKEVTA